MRCLSLHQPWAQFVVEGVKTIESRRWWTKHRGQLVICSTAKFPPVLWNEHMIGAALDRWGHEALALDPERFPLGRALGTVNVVDCVVADNVYVADEEDDWEISTVAGTPTEMAGGGWAWADPAGELSGHVLATSRERGLGDYDGDGWAWLLAKPSRFRAPVPVSGRQRIWQPSYAEQVLIQDQIDQAARAA